MWESADGVRILCLVIEAKRQRYQAIVKGTVDKRGLSAHLT